MARKPTGTVQWFGDHWRARVTLEDGSRPWLDLPASLGPNDRDKAQAKAAELATYAREHGVRRVARATLASDSETLTEYAERWFADRERRGLRSVRDDRGRLNTHVLPTLGALPLRAITEKDCRAIVASLDEKSREGALAWRTALNVWATFTKLLDDACHSKVEALRVLTEDPAKDVRAPDRGASRARCYLYPSELLQLVRCGKIALRWRRVYAVAVYTYARAGELEALRRGDVDFEHGVIRIHRQSDRYTGESIATKTKAARTVPIEPALRPLLEALARECPDADTPLVQLAPRQFGAAYLRDHLRAARLEREALFANDETRAPLTFHDLRASGITWCAVRGDDPAKLQRRAGHTTLATTDRYIREAENVRAGFGDVFPELPRDLCGSHDDGPNDPPSFRPSNRLSDQRAPDPERDFAAENPGETVKDSMASLTGFENVDARSISEKPGRIGVSHVVNAPRKRPDSPRSAHPGDDCGTARRAPVSSPRAVLVRALGEAVRAGLEAGDARLVQVAARALGELVDPGDGPVIDLATERARRGER